MCKKNRRNFSEGHTYDYRSDASHLVMAGVDTITVKELLGQQPHDDPPVCPPCSLP